MFEKHGTRGTWYAHASVGCLHVRPVLNLRLEKDVQGDARHRRGSLRDGARLQGLAFRRARRRHRALGIQRADVRRAPRARLRGGEGQLRSEGPAQSRQDGARAEVRRPQRCSATRRVITARTIKTQLDWSACPGAGGGFQGAVEMCNNNGACRKSPAASMCPSYRVTRDERDVTRGRANTLRLALTGQLGPDALTSDEMAETLEALRLLQGVPARMPDRRRHGAHEDRGAGRARREARALAARPAGRLAAALCADRGAAAVAVQSARPHAAARRSVSEALAGFSARRSLPRWRTDYFRDRPSWQLRAAGRPAGAKSYCSPTPSTAISSARTSMPP